MFVLPLYDDNPVGHSAVATWLIIGLCIAVFFWQISLPADLDQAAALSFGMVPAVLFGGASLDPELAVVPPWASLITSMFLHGGWLHILGNMLFLWIFGDNVEDAMGRPRFVLFYLLCGMVAALTQAFVFPASRLPMVGASGAIAGVLAAYLVLFPRANVRVLLVLFIFVRLINVPAAIVLGIWFTTQIISAGSAESASGGVAVWAHLGGFLCGLALLPLFKRRDIPLFGAGRTRAFATTVPRIGRRGRIPTVIPRDFSGPWDRPWN